MQMRGVSLKAKVVSLIELQVILKPGRSKARLKDKVVRPIVRKDRLRDRSSRVESSIVTARVPGQ